MFGIAGLFLAMLGIWVYHEQLSPTIAREYTLEPKVTGTTESLRTFEVQTILYYTQEDLELLARLINGEAVSEGILSETETNKSQCYTGAVVLNRLKSQHNGAETLEEVIFDEGQYACVTDQNWDKPVTERAYQNAKLLLSGAPYWEIYGFEKLPDNVIYQAEFEQGSDVFDTVGNTYFCYE